MKKLIVFVLCMSLTIGIIGCESKKETDNNKKTEESAKKDVVNDPDMYEGAVLYTDLINKVGAIPKPTKDLTIGFAAKAFENEFWGAVKKGVEAQGEELKKTGMNLTLDVRAGQGEADEQGQAALMNDMINKKYDAIIASPISDGNLVQATEKAQAAGIPVINTIGGFCQVMDVFVGPRSQQCGELAAEWISNKLGETGGNVAVIMGMPKESAARGRTEGFVQWLEKNNKNIKVVDTQNADWDRQKAKEVMDTLIKNHPDLKAVYVNNDTMVMGALESIMAAGKKEQILVVGNDGTNEALQSIKEGKLDATINMFPEYAGKISVDIALRKLGGQELPKVIYTNLAIIDSTNIDKDPEEVIGWTPLQFK